MGLCTESSREKQPSLGGLWKFLQSTCVVEMELFYEAMLYCKHVIETTRYVWISKYIFKLITGKAKLLNNIY